MTKVIVITVWALVGVFIILNFLVGCTSWEDPACITPSQMLGWIL